MDQIEVIKNKKILPDSFFEEEIRNDYKITKDKKELWAIMIDLYKEFEKVCARHGLNFYAAYGTLLGAVRHSGFIPWDDDMDFWMFREDYDRLKLLKDEFKYPYQLVWPESEDYNGFSFIKLRNAETTAHIESLKDVNINKGIFIDIFPLDEVNMKTFVKDQKVINDLIKRNSKNMKLIPLLSGIEASNLNNVIRDNFEQIEMIVSKDNNNNSDLMAVRVSCISREIPVLLNKQDFTDYKIIPFENFNIRIPYGWENLLTLLYEDWHKFPPIKERGTWFSSFKFLPRIPYKVYYNQKSEFSNSK